MSELMANASTMPACKILDPIAPFLTFLLSPKRYYDTIAPFHFSFPQNDLMTSFSEAALTIKICSKEISSDKSPEDGTILVPSSELKCFTNDDMGLVLRSMPWFTARHTSLRTLPLSE